MNTTRQTTTASNINTNSKRQIMLLAYTDLWKKKQREYKRLLEEFDTRFRLHLRPHPVRFSNRYGSHIPYLTRSRLQQAKYEVYRMLSKVRFGYSQSSKNPQNWNLPLDNTNHPRLTPPVGKPDTTIIRLEKEIQAFNYAIHGRPSRGSIGSRNYQPRIDGLRQILKNPEYTRKSSRITPPDRGPFR
tara:strand:+ start:833 stop:1393 length:561 start_codon:yes stop_codon:yes gene_type:complete